MSQNQKDAVRWLDSGRSMRAFGDDLRGKAKIYKSSYSRSWDSVVQRVRGDGYLVSRVRECDIDLLGGSKRLVWVAQKRPR